MDVKNSTKKRILAVTFAMSCLHNVIIINENVPPGTDGYV